MSIYDNPYVSGEKSLLSALLEKHNEIKKNKKHSKCPVCGFHAFNGEECFDCGYRP